MCVHIELNVVYFYFIAAKVEKTFSSWCPIPLRGYPISRNVIGFQLQ